MSLFKSPNPPTPPESPKAAESPIPVSILDPSKRYDLYCATLVEDVVYENVRIVGIKTLEKMHEYSSGLIGGFIEIETTDGIRMMIRHHNVNMVCEHGTQPQRKLLRVRSGINPNVM